MRVFFCICVILTIGMITAPTLVALTDYPGTWIQRLEGLIRDHNGLIISLGTIFLILGLTVWTTSLVNASAEARESSNRRVQAELKISDFRQIWINEPRDDLSKFISRILWSEGEQAEIEEIGSRIVLRMNMNEELAKNLGSAIHRLANTSSPIPPDEKPQAIADFYQHSREYLKSEWDTLKRNLLQAQNKEG